MNLKTSPTSRHQDSFLFSVLVCSILFVLQVNVQAQNPDSVVALVNGEKITLQEVDETIEAQLFPLQQQLYALRKAALSNLVTAKLLHNEALRRKISIDQLRKELMAGTIEVTSAQVADAYKQNSPLLALMSEHEARERLRLDLESQQRMKLFRKALEKLRSSSEITLSLEQPPATAKLDDGLSPGKGSDKPLVTIVEFSDFQCPYCKQAQSTVAQVLERYSDQVKLVFKHLPSEGHPNALQAASAAVCAGEQKRFWEFHDRLFDSNDLSSVAVENIAVQLGLNMSRFRACLVSESPRNVIVKDIESARLLRIDSTPSFVINGKVVTGAIGFGEFQRLIDLELRQQAGSKSSSTN
jgi:protein-disulfide isomerase